MVSEADTQLFFEAVDALGTRPASFGSLDDLLENFGLTYEKAPFHDGFIRASVGNLSKESPWSDDYKRFLLQVKPETSTRYLVGALANPACVDAAKFVLLGYGASRETVNPLVGALANPTQRSASLEVLLSYGASRVTVRPLVGALADPERVDAAKFVLLGYGASRDTVNPLVGALADPDPNRVAAAAEVLVSYGQKAERFIHPPIPGTRLYEPITMIISRINAKAA